MHLLYLESWTLLLDEMKEAMARARDYDRFVWSFVGFEKKTKASWMKFVLVRMTSYLKVRDLHI